RVPPRSPALRAALWDHGAALERGGADVSHAVQPRALVLGGHLGVQDAPRGLYPPSADWPRALPAPRAAEPPVDEPDTLDDLLGAPARGVGRACRARGRRT